MNKQLVADLRKQAGDSLPVSGRRGLLMLVREAADALEKADQENAVLRAALEEYVKAEAPVLEAARAALEKIDE